MYLQTSRLQYNLQGVGVFQTAHSDKNIQAEACKAIISQEDEKCNSRRTRIEFLLPPALRRFIHIYLLQ